MGSTRMARRVGMKHAKSATAHSRIVTLEKVSASVLKIPESTTGVKSKVSPSPESDSSSECGICEQSAILDAHGVGARRVQQGAAGAVNDVYSRLKSSICARTQAEPVGGTALLQLLSDRAEFLFVPAR